MLTCSVRLLIFRIADEHTFVAFPPSHVRLKVYVVSLVQVNRPLVS